MQRACVHHRRTGPIGRRAALLLTLSWAALLAPAGALLDRAAAKDLQRLEIVGKNGTHVLKVEVADTDAERARGLMFRREVPEGYGMLFDFQTEQPVAFWMKNTPLPLDMLFIDGKGRVVQIAEDTEPYSEAPVPSQQPVRAVLELNAGVSRKLGITPGARVDHPIFGTGGNG